MTPKDETRTPWDLHNDLKFIFFLCDICRQRSEFKMTMQRPEN